MLTGTLATNSGRYEVVTRSPLTGAMAASNSGGYWGPELKYAGYDMIIFEGQSPKPVYLDIYNEKVSLKDASKFWGMDVPKSTAGLIAETDPDAKVACIGPAGENKVLIAAIMNDDHRAAGRERRRCCNGFKKTQGCRFVRGTKGIKIGDRQKFMEAVRESRRPSC